jgi:hypothetical protein
VIKAVRGTAEGRQVSPLGAASALIAACSCMLCICRSEDEHSLSACGEIVAYAPAAQMFDIRWALRLSRGSPRGLVFCPSLLLCAATEREVQNIVGLPLPHRPPFTLRPPLPKLLNHPDPPQMWQNL